MTTDPPPPGPLRAAFNDAIHELAEQAREQDQQTEKDARKQIARKSFSRILWIGIALIIVQLGIFVVLYSMPRSEITVTAPVRRAILPEKSCDNAKVRAYWKVVAYLRDNGHLPASLGDLVPQYTPQAPYDPLTGKQLLYSVNGERFELSCPSTAPVR